MQQGTLGQSRVCITSTHEFKMWSHDHDMTKPSLKSAPEPQQQIPEELATEIRKLAHDLSNALEIIVQTSYLLNMAELKEPASEWLRMLDTGVTKALDLNMQLREYIKVHTPR
jgi:hypothetical protein